MKNTIKYLATDIEAFGKASRSDHKGIILREDTLLLIPLAQGLSEPLPSLTPVEIKRSPFEIPDEYKTENCRAELQEFFDKWKQWLKSQETKARKRYGKLVDKKKKAEAKKQLRKFAQMVRQLPKITLEEYADQFGGRDRLWLKRNRDKIRPYKGEWEDLKGKEKLARRGSIDAPPWEKATQQLYLNCSPNDQRADRIIEQTRFEAIYSDGTRRYLKNVVRDSHTSEETEIVAKGKEQRRPHILLEFDKEKREVKLDGEPYSFSRREKDKEGKPNIEREWILSFVEKVYDIISNPPGEALREDKEHGGTYVEINCHDLIIKLLETEFKNGMKSQPYIKKYRNKPGELYNVFFGKGDKKKLFNRILRPLRRFTADAPRSGKLRGYKLVD